MKNRPVLEMHYQEPEVVMTQRFFLLESGQMRRGITTFVLMVVAFALIDLYYAFQPGGIDQVRNFILLEVGALALGILIPVGTFFYMPVFNFRNRPEWKLTFNVQLTEMGFLISPKGAKATNKFTRNWEQIQTVLETSLAYMLIWGNNPQDSIILPKRILKGQQDFMLDQLRQKSQAIWKVLKS